MTQTAIDECSSPSTLNNALHLTAQLMNRSRTVLIGWLTIGVLLILLIPWKSQIAPPWTIKVVDEGGRPVGNLAVSQNWIDPNFKMLWLEEDFRTDENGNVSFPERSTWRNVLLTTVSPIWNRPLSDHGYDATVFGWGNYRRGQVWYRKGQALPDKLVMHR